jgi:prepilin-type N-terminal cleavage/methylation domain-containing protein
MNGLKGFTLIELLVTISVLAILSTLAAPNIQDALARQEVRRAAFELANTLQQARSTAVFERRSVIVRSTYPTAVANNNWNGKSGTPYDNNLPAAEKTKVSGSSWYVFKAGSEATYLVANNNNLVLSQAAIGENTRVNFPNGVAIRFLRDATMQVENQVNAGFAVGGNQVFTICNNRTEQGRQVTITTFGNVSVSAPQTGVC